ncbi:hypothetical protein H9P43_001745 [Blastocladiella emersonii ATCC 22665]|nr:hypothetical protein H9P43_001745 [Blastocladiella emersonii ATCC 22665]
MGIDEDFSKNTPGEVNVPETPPLSAQLLESYKPARLCQENTKRITSLHFDDSGQYLVTASEDDSIRIYDCNTATHQRVSFSKKYGCHLARFTHDGPTKVLYASTKESGERADADVIRYLDTPTNQYIRYYKGHKHSVTSLEVSPVDDLVVSASLDGTVRLWDTRSPNCQGCITLGTSQRAVAGIDSTGRVMAVVTYNTADPKELPYVRLFDARNIDTGAFATQPLLDPTATYTPNGRVPAIPPLSGVKFSPDGKKILVTTTGDAHFVVDSYDPERTYCKVGQQSAPDAAGGNNSSSNGNGGGPASSGPSLTDVWVGGEADFAPDSAHVVVANAAEGGTIGVYQIPAVPAAVTVPGVPEPLGSASTGQLVCQLDYVAPTPVHRVAFNHRLNTMVSSSHSALCFWIPEN